MLRTKLRWRAPGIAVEHQGHRDLPAPALREESTSADLLVVGSTAVAADLPACCSECVSRQCVHRSACQVIVVRPSDPGDMRHRPVNRRVVKPRSCSSPQSEGRRIVVGIDRIAVLDCRTACWAADEAESTGAVLELYHSWEWLTGAGWAPVPSISTLSTVPRR